jgi:hypothetical protein
MDLFGRWRELHHDKYYLSKEHEELHVCKCVAYFSIEGGKYYKKKQAWINNRKSKNGGNGKQREKILIS